MKKLIASTLLAGTLGLAGCMTPNGGVAPAPVNKTAPESSAIPAPCRTALEATPAGQQLLNLTDVELGGVTTLNDPAAETANLLSALTVSARAMGVTDCG